MLSLLANPRFMRRCSAAAIAIGIFAVLSPSLFPQATLGMHAMVGALVGSFSFTLGITLWVFRATPETSPKSRK